MDYSRFYTPQKVAEFLIGQIDISSPTQAVDICCGSCNLLRAAKKRWKEICLNGVDIVDHTAPGVEFTKQDGRKYALENQGLYNLVLANPPFAQIEKKDYCRALYTDYPKRHKISRLENEMLLANLHLLSPNGILMAIMPSTFVEAEKNQVFRKYIAQKYHIHKIFELPIDTFGASMIKSYAVYFSTQKNNNRGCNIYSLHSEAGNPSTYALMNKRYIPIESIREGTWIGVEEQPQTGFPIQRGTISSQHFSEIGIPILHTAKWKQEWAPSIRYIKELPNPVVFAEEGDIVVSRIGKSAGQWTIHHGSKCAISDCLYRISDPSGAIKKKLSNYVYTNIVKGVATKYITINDFYTWYNTLSNVAV